MTDKEEVEFKIMTKKRFTTAVENLVVKGRLTYLESIIKVIEENGLDMSAVKRLLNDALREKLEQEAIDHRLLKTPKGNTLPGL